jgi:hypothetical protein
VTVEQRRDWTDWIVSNEDTAQEDPKRYESGQLAEKPAVTEEHKQRAHDIAQSYMETRPTTVLPGSDRAVSGTAVNEWVDDDGNPKFGNDDSESQKAE